ncbi:UDP-N-acetylmuramoyl-L-alanyl-D-glutamate--2,6-diaminopimelate ligase [Ruminococcus flavefaciens]|uniref:UDP-N-acetylmuramoyl-L-alanyl-D-glutamate--2,6-diaminopimelate ligase n=1 Tax=Ruminococcus flavefaciens TaxID=1265 RepID=A0A1K1P8Y6_RUMFL|nr:UDP-N-acetylmuramoyl-L-alanyl-D-glutamate--2,6-diaminopimelate ligase [Ruminococcus flavefaciens]SFW43150.1 UDP-N-acetylmuramoylalanyl-D-glutamate--2,6-diaminopimelate ligase [Ruminococcus flavefaciens]
MKLCDLIENNAVTAIGDTEISSVTDDTRKVTEGSLFVCVKGGSFDGHTAAKEMLEKGAAAVVCERDLGLGDRQIITENSRKLYGQICSAWFGHPERKMKMIGVTGTNGKTTITNVIKHILMKNGHKTGLVGTIQNEIGDEILHTDNTTPMAYDFMGLLAKMADAGCEYVVMEVSSFGLCQYRIGSSYFDVAVFTNLTQDHLDYHKDMEDYYQAKKMLFDICDCAVINADDDYGRRLFGEVSCKKLGFSVKENADFYADGIKIKSTGSSFWFCNGDKSHLIKTRMPGLFNVSNITAAIAACLEAGLNIENIIPAVEEYNGVKGRCEVIPTGLDFTVICDYAHTPDAVENILRSVKEYTENDLICLFGCGGNRDAAKRPKMAKAAAKYADKLIVTSDNPRNEEPEAIIKDILVGLEGTDVNYDVVVDRKEAIFHALKIAEKGDIIVLAGKGHEDYQILAGMEHIHFDEREIVAEGLKLLNK